MNRIEIAQSGRLMAALLGGASFDAFSFIEADLMLSNHIHLDGEILWDFYKQDDTAEILNELPSDGTPARKYSHWEEVRPMLFSLIKGKKLPLRCKFVLHAPKEVMNSLLSSEQNSVPTDAVNSLVMTILYSEGKASVTTATNLNTFLPDKSLENLWDGYVEKLLSSF